MAIHEDNRDIIKDKMWDRLEQCIGQLQGLENILLESEETTHYHAEAKEKIGAALKLVDAFGNSLEDEKQVNEALESAEHYLQQDIFREIVFKSREMDRKIKEIEEKIAKARKQRVDENDDEWVHILHLSDLHFGIYTEKDSDNPSSRKFFRAVETQLFDFLKNYIAQNHKIDIVAITGDISFCHNEKGYNDFKNWLEKLCGQDILGININDHVIMCPGNHDSEYADRSKENLISKVCKEGSVGGILTIEKIRSRQDQFWHFNKICKQLGIEPLKNFITTKSKRTVPYVMGIKEIDGIHFAVLNSAWNSFPRNKKNGSDYGQLLLGRELIQSMFEDTKISEEEMTVMLFHHPLAWLHEEEIRTYGKDQLDPSSTLIRRHADVILSGHIHGGIKPPDILENKTVVFTGGTLYTEDSYLNQFEIISVNKTRHFCRQKIVRYNKQEENGEPFGWEIAGEKYPSRIYYGIYRDIRDLAARYSLGEISKQEAEQEASLRSATVGLKVFQELVETMRYHQLNDMETEKDLRQQETVSDTLEQSEGQTKTMTIDSGAGEKRS